MRYRVYITALQYGCETVEAESEDEAKQEIGKRFKLEKQFHTPEAEAFVDSNGRILCVPFPAGAFM